MCIEFIDLVYVANIITSVIKYRKTLWIVRPETTEIPTILLGDWIKGIDV